MASMRYIRDENHKSGRGRGNPTPFASGNNKWSCPERSAPSRWEGRGGRGERGRGFAGRSGRGRGRFSNQSFVRSSVGAVPEKNYPTATSSVVDGKGNKWVRNPEEKSTENDTQDSTILSKNAASGDAIPTDNVQVDVSVIEVVENSTTADNHQNLFLERRGKHKLVMKQDDTECSKPTQQNDTVMQEGCITINAMERKGPGKLVLKRDDSKSVHESLAKDQTDFLKQIPPTKSSSGSSRSWKRQPSELSTEPNIEKIKENRSEGNQKLDQGVSHAQHPRKRNRYPTVAGSRRICLVQTSSNNAHSQDLGEDTPADVSEVAKISDSKDSCADLPSATTQKTLTDHCYRDTGRGRGRGATSGRGHIHSGQATGVRSMGLVRVKSQNPSSTPICPTFRRGISCNNPKCALRHDVSTEASRPICVFFQRNGMCSKGDECPFRHVKVRWDAEICPAFERVGYCEDEDCVLRHVKAKKPRNDLSFAPSRK